MNESAIHTARPVPPIPEHVVTNTRTLYQYVHLMRNAQGSCSQTVSTPSHSLLIIKSICSSIRICTQHSFLSGCQIHAAAPLISKRAPHWRTSFLSVPRSGAPHFQACCTVGADIFTEHSSARVYMYISGVGGCRGGCQDEQ